MAPRNPDESPDKDLRNKILQAIHEALNGNAGDPAAPMQQSTLVSEARQEDARDTKIELDRVETYLKGPTAFTA